MESFIWAIAAFLFIMLIMYFLPVGMTKKGKLIVVSAGFLLSLAGLAAALTFSFLLTLLMIIVLIFFVSYILDSRVGPILYIQEGIIEQHALSEDNSKIILTETYNLEVPSENEISTIPFQLSMNEQNENIQTDENNEEFLDAMETEENDISYMLNRRLSVEDEVNEKEKEREKENEPPVQEVDYLAEIEELLNDDAYEQPDSTRKQAEQIVEEDNGLTDTDEIPVLPYLGKGDDE